MEWVSKNLPVNIPSRAYGIVLHRGNCTLTHIGKITSGHRIFRAPGLIVLPPGRTEKVDLQGSWTSMAMDEESWVAAGDFLSSRHSSLPVRGESIGLEKQDEDFLTGIITGLMTELRRELKSTNPQKNPPEKDQLSPVEFSGILMVLSFFCSRLASSLEDTFPWTLDSVVSHVNHNYAACPNLDFYAAQCAMNTSSFCRAFKHHTGYPLFEYINRIRIRHACRLLKYSRSSVLDISQSLGYNNLSFFNRYFRKVVGCSPSDYRKSK